MYMNGKYILAYLLLRVRVRVRVCISEYLLDQSNNTSTIIDLHTRIRILLKIIYIKSIQSKG